MKNWKVILGIYLMVMTTFLAYAQQYNPENDFRIEPIEGGKSVRITAYVGSNQTVRIPPRIGQFTVTHIGSHAFLDKSLIDVTIPNSVTHIGNYAFAGNQLPNITIPDSVTSIAHNTFVENQRLTAINVSRNNLNFSSIDGVLYDKTGETLLHWPLGKTPVTIPNSVTHIGDFAFQDNQLTSIAIPDSVTSIGAGAFSFNQLTSITIPDSVTSIGIGAFAHNQLTSIAIPDSVTSIGVSAFSFNQRLTAINVSRNNLNFSSIDGVLYDKTGETLLHWPQRKTPVIISNSVTHIGNYAFCSIRLTSITIPNSVTSIGRWAFRDNQLTSITIPSSVTHIGDYAFDNNVTITKR